MVKKLNSKLWMILLMFAFLAACGSVATQGLRMEEPSESAGAPGFAAEIAVEEPAFAPAAEPAASDNFQVGIPSERLIIRTADLDIVVADTAESLQALNKLAADMGGWVVRSGIYNFGTADRGNISMRIPAENFDQALATIKAGAVDVNSESTSGQDVTEEFVDLSARLANLEATADRVRSFLDDARRVEDALAVNQELSRLEEQIEVIKGRMKYLSESAAFSTINVNLTPDELNQPLEVAGWRPQGVARDAIEALIIAGQNLVDVLIWLVLFFLPVLLIIGLPLYFIARFVRRRWRQRGAASEAAGGSS